MIPSAGKLIFLAFIAASCTSTSSPRTIQAVDAQRPQLVGRWIYSPGDSSRTKQSQDANSTDGVQSPIGSSLSLGEGGIASARADEFVRRGTWKISMGSLKLIFDPPPDRKELSFVPTVEVDRLTLTGADGVALVYQRDPFIAMPGLLGTIPHAPSKEAVDGSQPGSNEQPAKK